MNNIEVFYDTQKRIKSSIELSQSTQKAINNTCVYGEGFVSNKITKFEQMLVSFEENLTLRTAIRMVDEGKKTAVLNFANPVEPGGGVLRGANAQEEYLCRTSNLYNCMVSENAKKYYEYHNGLIKMNQVNRMFLGTDMVIYSPDVTIFKEDIGYYPGMRYQSKQEYEYMDKWRNIDVITCAAPFFSGSDFVIPAGDLHHLFCTRIRNVLEVAIENNIEVLVLGAFGCGAFNNPPKVVAKAFLTVLLEERYKKAFTNVIFAVKRTKECSENVEAFKWLARKFALIEETSGKNVIQSYIGFQNAQTGVCGHEFYDESLRSICSMGAVLDPECEHMHIKGFGLCWNSKWNWDKTRNLMDCRAIMDSSGAEVAGITNYCDPENYTIFWGKEKIEVFIEENAYTFIQNRQVIASIERFHNDKYFPENCEDLMIRYGLCVRLYEKLQNEILLLILSFPALKF